jgi:hypothetical protein
MIQISPETRRIFRAARLEGEIMELCPRISVSPERETRLALLKEAEAVLEEMRELAVQQFDGKPFILENIEGLRAATRTLADLSLVVHEAGVCPACGSLLVTLPTASSIKLCEICTERIYEYCDRLSSDDGFMTDAI